MRRDIGAVLAGLGTLLIVMAVPAADTADGATPAPAPADVIPGLESKEAPKEPEKKPAE
jgi:hypothetical protein